MQVNVDWEEELRRLNADIAAAAERVRQIKQIKQVEHANKEAWADGELGLSSRPERMEIGDAAFQEADRRYVRLLWKGQLELLRQKRRRT